MADQQWTTHCPVNNCLQMWSKYARVVIAPELWTAFVWMMLAALDLKKKHPVVAASIEKA
jgi:hypothetical protein